MNNVASPEVKSAPGPSLWFWPAVRMWLCLSVLTGVLYPLSVTMLANALFAQQAAGSLVLSGDGVRGSWLIGQAFDQPRYFWGRPSATADAPYNPQGSAGANLGPLNPTRQEQLQTRVQQLRALDLARQARVPIDLVTASASGLDPDISPAAARYQLPRVAQARALPAAALEPLIARCTQPRQWGFVGEPRVNVLCMNIALDADQARTDMSAAP